MPISAHSPLSQPPVDGKYTFLTRIIQSLGGLLKLLVSPFVHLYTAVNGYFKHQQEKRQLRQELLETHTTAKVVIDQLNLQQLQNLKKIPAGQLNACIEQLGRQPVYAKAVLSLSLPANESDLYLNLLNETQPSANSIHLINCCKTILSPTSSHQDKQKAYFNLSSFAGLNSSETKLSELTTSTHEQHSDLNLVLRAVDKQLNNRLNSTQKQALFSSLLQASESDSDVINKLKKVLNASEYKIEGLESDPDFSIEKNSLTTACQIIKTLAESKQANTEALQVARVLRPLFPKLSQQIKGLTQSLLNNQLSLDQLKILNDILIAKSSENPDDLFRLYDTLIQVQEINAFQIKYRTLISDELFEKIAGDLGQLVYVNHHEYATFGASYTQEIISRNLRPQNAQALQRAILWKFVEGKDARWPTGDIGNADIARISVVCPLSSLNIITIQEIPSPQGTGYVTFRLQERSGQAVVFKVKVPDSFVEADKRLKLESILHYSNTQADPSEKQIAADFLQAYDLAHLFAVNQLRYSSSFAAAKNPAVLQEQIQDGILYTVNGHLSLTPSSPSTKLSQYATAKFFQDQMTSQWQEKFSKDSTASLNFWTVEQGQLKTVPLALEIRPFLRPDNTARPDSWILVAKRENGTEIFVDCFVPTDDSKLTKMELLQGSFFERFLLLAEARLLKA